MQIEKYLNEDDRCVLPLGCTEQHAYLSLATDTRLAERVSIDAAEPLGIPVFPTIAYGMTPSFMAYPGTVSISLPTYAAILSDVLSGLHQQGFNRIVIVNGHGGNTPARTCVTEWVQKQSSATVVWHDWWCAPKVWDKVQRIDPIASHASWMENFPWTRLEPDLSPTEAKHPTDFATLRTAHATEVREKLGDGNFGGLYKRSDTDMMEIWTVAVEEAREILQAI